jgi:hypothetical protein
VSSNQSSQQKCIVIPGKLALASAIRIPEIQYIWIPAGVYPEQSEGPV